MGYMEYNIKYIGYSGYTIKYIKYMGFGTHPNIFFIFFHGFRTFPEKIYENIGKHFLKKSLPYESWGQTPMPKSLVNGSSSYDFFMEILREPCILPSKSHFFLETLFLI